MEQSESQKLASAVKIERKAGRPKSIKVVNDVIPVGVPEFKSVSEPKNIGKLDATPAVQDSAMLKRFASKPRDYRGWVKLSVEEAEELGLAGKLLGHDPKLGLGLLAPEA